MKFSALRPELPRPAFLRSCSETSVPVALRSVIRPFTCSARAALCLLLLSGLLPVFLSGCSLWGKDEPEVRVMEERSKALIDLGWQWLHAENMIFQDGYFQGERYIAHFSYEVVIDEDESALPFFEKDRFAHFLPMCRAVGLQKGARCALMESIPFVRSENYGWMPEMALRFPEAQIRIIAGQGRAPDFRATGTGPAGEKAVEEKTAGEKAPEEKAAGEKAAGEKAAGEKPASENAAMDDRAARKRATTEEKTKPETAN